MFAYANCDFDYLYGFGWFWDCFSWVTILAVCLFDVVVFCYLLFSLVLCLRWCLGIALVGLADESIDVFDLGLELVLFKGEFGNFGRLLRRGF